MKLSEILSISGQSGLFKFVAQSANGMIVEALADGRRTNIPATARVSSMGEIAIYTDTDDMPLSEVLEALFKHTEGAVTIGHKSPNDRLKELFAEVVPTYARDMVHISDMKKIVQWYNILVEAGMTDFSIEEEEEEEEVAEEQEIKKEKKVKQEKSQENKEKQEKKENKEKKVEGK